MGLYLVDASRNKVHLATKDQSYFHSVSRTKSGRPRLIPRYLLCRHSAIFTDIIGIIMLLEKPWSCNDIYKLEYGFYALSQIAASFIFWQRINALWGNKKSVYWVFGVFWVILAGVWISIPPFFSLQQLPLEALPNPHGGWCYQADAPAWTAVAWGVTCAFDLAVFIATLIRLQQLGHWNSFSNTSRVFFRDGIGYFGLSLFVNLLALFFILLAQNGTIKVMIQPFSILFTVTIPPRIVLDLKESNDKQQPGTKQYSNPFSGHLSNFDNRDTRKTYMPTNPRTASRLDDTTSLNFGSGFPSPSLFEMGNRRAPEDGIRVEQRVYYHAN